MRIAMVGGIFEYRPDVWTRLQATPEINLLRGLSARGHEVLPIGIRDWRGALSAASSVDVTHVHQAGPATLALGLRRTPAPLVYTPHCGSVPARVRQRIAHRRMLRRADAVVALSPAEAARCEAATGRGGRTLVIPNGMDGTHFTPVARAAPSGGERFRLLYVGQLIPLKQVDLLIRAVAEPELRGRCELRLVYHIDHRETELRRLARDLGVHEQVAFVGRRSGPALVREYHQAHIHLLASRTEAMPSVVTEAMLTGLPVIAPDVGGIAWQLDGWGHCLRTLSVESVVAAVLRTMRDYADYSKESNRVAAAARARFALAAMVESHEDLYRNVRKGAGVGGL
ncbi:glycosyltransferase family 4 protein [Actinomadura sp. WMMA1423]|uniref:glycosyltransferase family 4 protein n=1 Tax=Actinomadura sp. WMMA1423 TaxID=2591108 RepID=UPI0011475C6C|nr:glycosyltransferase family 4 protein [Actinomadura sp. WMMA1423]